MLVTLKTLMADTGKSASTVQAYRNLGIVQGRQSDRKQGRSFRTDYDAALPFFGERTWAIVGAELDNMRLPLGDIAKIIDSFRRVVEMSGDPAEVTRDQWKRWLSMTPIGEALLGRHSLVLVGVDKEGEAFWSNLVKKSAREAEIEVTIFDSIRGSDGEPGKLYSKIEAEIDGGFLLEHKTAQVLNLGLILAPLAAELKAEMEKGE